MSVQTPAPGRTCADLTPVGDLLQLQSWSIQSSSHRIVIRPGDAVTAWWSGLPTELKVAAVAVTVVGVGLFVVWIESLWRGR